MYTDTRQFATNEVRSTLADDSVNTTRRLQSGETFGAEFWFFIAALACLFGGGLIALIAGFNSDTILIVVCVLGLLAVAGLAFWVRRELLVPMRALRVWAVGMCGGDLTTRIKTPAGGEFARLAFHVNRLSHALDKLANDMDDVVTTQTARLEHKTQSIAILYEVAATLNEPGEVDGMLRAAARKLVELVGAFGAIARSVDDDGLLTDELVVLDGFRGAAAPTLGAPTPGAPTVDERVGADVSICSALAAGYTMDDCATHQVIRVPLRYRNRPAGSIDLFLEHPLNNESDVVPLFESVGKHLGMAVEKSRLDVQAHKLLMGRERTALAHELHDSLAQTIVGLRMQVKMLGETLDAGDSGAGKREARRIAAAVEEAHTELRELLANFRAPIDERGVMFVLQDLVDRARADDANCTWFLHLEGEEPILPAATQMQMTRIVGEALTNARKHAGAQAVRVLMKNEHTGGVQVLVEDDGVGIGERVLDARPGENVGLSIMRERAQRVGGELLIESEPGEGTRVELRLPPITEHC
jgi:two-component system, NarL family, nitrate/nitrite sensor histidine kinase NarX